MVVSSLTIPIQCISMRQITKLSLLSCRVLELLVLELLIELRTAPDTSLFMHSTYTKLCQRKTCIKISGVQIRYRTNPNKFKSTCTSSNPNQIQSQMFPLNPLVQIQKVDLNWIQIKSGFGFAHHCLRSLSLSYKRRIGGMGPPILLLK